jgi:hypothetical protein
MRFSVDGWDPTYGTSLEFGEYLGASPASVEVGLELVSDQWRPIDPHPGQALPAALLFVDGVRRIEARVWIDEDTPDGRLATQASAALCAFIRGRHRVLLRPAGSRSAGRGRRGLFTVASHASDIATWAREYTAHPPRQHSHAPGETLSQALQRRLGEVEVTTAVAAWAALPGRRCPGTACRQKATCS